MSKTAEVKIIATGIVNENCYGTWLEPYRNWEFEIIKYSRSYVWFLMDNGKPVKDVTKYHRDVFEITDKL